MGLVIKLLVYAITIFITLFNKIDLVEQEDRISNAKGIYVINEEVKPLRNFKNQDYNIDTGRYSLTVLDSVYEEADAYIDGICEKLTNEQYRKFCSKCRFNEDIDVDSLNYKNYAVMKVRKYSIGQADVMIDSLTITDGVIDLECAIEDISCAEEECCFVVVGSNEEIENMNMVIERIPIVYND